MIYYLKPGSDVTDTCFNECLEIAVQKNLHLAAGFIILRIPSNAADCLQKAIDIGHDETAVMLMLCLAAMKNGITLLRLICRPSYETQVGGTIPGSNKDKPISISLQLPGNQPIIVNEELLNRLRWLTLFHPINCTLEKLGSISQLTFTCSKSTIKTPEKVMKYVRS